ncbi:hypothetical protein BTH42_00670 [Burkholderia sp. SRS-W-2-2016]|uniref:hypothetical protein n=1 Tax=Burkholderia sp. SRS-W-2-2016 TaxID=1926878 RepID=UPI00094B5FD2|nr:hypothetical protein [Burkholderia sp. SRS-W-2-2016]OLL33542.1 hypothetical protein BTH42_00670 [Burkholderia sp. SRS-W-2-2016]
MNTLHSIKTLAAAAAVSLALAACGGGGGGGSSGGGTGTDTGTTTSSTNGAALLAAYNPPADIAADVVTNYTGPAYNVGNSGIASNCSNPAVTSTTVVTTTNLAVFSANGASLKAQELAADLAEQAIVSVRTYFNQPASPVGFDGTSKIQLCVDTAMGAPQANGTAITGQTALNVSQVMSADSPNFDQRFAGATSYAPYLGLFRHEMSHAYNYAAVEPFGNGLEIFYLEGTAQNVAQEPLPDKATLLGYVNSMDLLSLTNNDSNLTVLPAYEAIMNYLVRSTAGALNNGQASLQTLLATFKAKALATCAQPIPVGLIPTAGQTAGMPAGDYNLCFSQPGTVDTREQAAFDAAFNSTFKDSNGAPLLLHTADDPSGNSLEQTLYQRLNGFLQ